MTPKEKKDFLISDFLFAQIKHDGCASVKVARDCARLCINQITSALEQCGQETEWWNKVYNEI